MACTALRRRTRPSAKMHSLTRILPLHYLASCPLLVLQRKGLAPAILNPVAPTTEGRASQPDTRPAISSWLQPPRSACGSQCREAIGRMTSGSARMPRLALACQSNGPGRETDCRRRDKAKRKKGPDQMPGRLQGSGGNTSRGSTRGKNRAPASSRGPSSGVSTAEPGTSLQEGTHELRRKAGI